MSEPNWGEFAVRGAASDQAAVSDELDAACAAVFITAEGKRLLEQLRKRYVEAPVALLSESRALRVRATQQQFVRDLEAARDRGLEAAAKRKAK